MAFPLSKFQFVILTVIFLIAFMARLHSLSPSPFFCDVPGNVLAVENGGMRIQFPGYVPFHLTIRLFKMILGSAFAGLIFFSFICGLGALLYCMLFAYERAGFRGAVLASAGMAFSPIAIYFSCVGSSYTTDLLAMSALIYHGNRVLTQNRNRDYTYAVLWFVFGCLMRSLSFPFVGLAVLYLLWKNPTRQNIIFTLLSFAIGGFLYAAPTFYFFGSINNILNSMAPAKITVAHAINFSWFAGNEIRNVTFVIWALNIYLFVVLACLWFGRKKLNRNLAIFFSLLALPYSAFLIWYDPHAGYICLVLPALICSPWIVEKKMLLDSWAMSVAAIFGIISFVLFFVAHPVPATGPVSLLSDSYLLTYTHQGIEQCLFDNLRGWADKYHLPGYDHP